MSKGDNLLKDIICKNYLLFYRSLRNSLFKNLLSLRLNKLFNIDLERSVFLNLPVI